MLHPQFSPRACTVLFWGDCQGWVCCQSIQPLFSCRVTGGELFEDIVAREYYSEADAR